MTGPANRPPLKNASSPVINQDLTSEYMNPIFSGSQGSQLGDAVQPSNLNFAPPPRTAGLAPHASGFGATNLMSEADFEQFCLDNPVLAKYFEIGEDDEHVTPISEMPIPDVPETAPIFDLWEKAAQRLM